MKSIVDHIELDRKIIEDPQSKILKSEDPQLRGLEDPYMKIYKIKDPRLRVFT